MDHSNYLRALRDAILNMDLEGIPAVAQAAMDAGVDPSEAITEGMVPGMVEVGQKFEEGEYFLSELVVAGEVMKDGMKVIEPYLMLGAIATVPYACTGSDALAVPSLTRMMMLLAVPAAVGVPESRPVAVLNVAPYARRYTSHSSPFSSSATGRDT